MASRAALVIPVPKQSSMTSLGQDLARLITPLSFIDAIPLMLTACRLGQNPASAIKAPSEILVLRMDEGLACECCGKKRGLFLVRVPQATKTVQNYRDIAPNSSFNTQSESEAVTKQETSAV
jgi:hypothetical protein